MRKKITMYKILEWVLICATLILLGMVLALLVYKEYLPLEIYLRWPRYFVFAAMLYLLQILVRECRHLEEREAHRMFIHFIEEQLKEEQEGEKREEEDDV